MKKTLALLVAIGILLILWILYRETEDFFKTPTHGEETAWVEYESPSGLFKVSFPTKPEFKTGMQRDANGFAVRADEIYSAEDKSDNLYLIYFVRYLSEEGKAPLPSNTLMNNLMYEILEKEQGSQLLGFKKVTFKGMPALEFGIANQGLLMDNLTFVHQGDLYLLSLTGKENSYPRQNFEKFTHSFELK